MADAPAEDSTVGMLAGGVTVDPVSGALGRDSTKSATTPARAKATMATVTRERIEVPPNHAQNHLGQAPYTPGVPMTSSS
ncbi:MAG: hypothetical protein H0U97_21285 [Gammaproteobacteria bacterium]|nr:hypothetical protein [Gammaproteobacteria bacterium]